MRIKQVMIIAILSVIVLALLLPFMLPSLLESYLEHKLESNELTDVQVDIGHIGPDSMHIKKIRFFIPGQDYRTELITHQLVIRYSPASLLNRQVDAIDIKTLNILANKNKDPMTVVHELNNRISLPLLNDIPFQSLHLNRGRVVVRGDSSDDIALSVTAQLEKSRDSLQARLTMQRVGQKVMHASLEYLQSGRISATLREDDAEDALLNLQTQRIVIVQQQLNTTIKAQVDAGRLGAFLQSLGLAQGIDHPGGKVTAKANMKIPLDLSMPASEWLLESSVEAQMDLDVRVRHWQGLGKDLTATLPISLSVKDGLLNWHISKQAGVTVRTDLHGLMPEKNTLGWLSKAEGKQLLSISFPEGLSGQVGQRQNMKNISIKNAQYIKVDFGQSGKLFGVKLKLVAPVLRAEQDWSLRSRASYQINFPHMKRPEIHALNVSGSADIVLTKNSVQLDIEKDASVTARSYRNESLTASGLDAGLLDPARCQMSFATQMWRCAVFTARLSVADIVSPEMTYQFQNGRLKVLDLNNENKGIFLRSRLDLTENVIGLKDSTLKLDKVWVDTSLKESQLSGQLRMEWAKSAVQMNLHFRHSILSTQGELDFVLKEVDFSAAPPDLLAKIVARPVMPLQLTAGKLSSQGHLSWKPTKKGRQLRLTGKGVLVLQALKGKLKNSDFNGVSTRLAAAIGEQGMVIGPASVSVDSINTGVEITDISFMLSGQLDGDGKPRLHFGRFMAKTLEGALDSDAIDLDLNKSNNPFVIRFHDLSLAKLLQLEKDQGLSGTGVIDGVLPFDYKSGEGLYMQQGQILARDPGGLLQYQATERVRALAKNNPNIKLLLDALNNFNYNKLKADASYIPSGKLNLNVLLQGSNPGFQRGRSVHFNVNVEENILQLMRSLQLGDEISERLGDRLLKQKH